MLLSDLFLIMPVVCFWLYLLLTMSLAVAKVVSFVVAKFATKPETVGIAAKPEIASAKTTCVPFDLPVASAGASTRSMIEKFEYGIANSPDKDYWNNQILACKAKNSSSTSTRANVTCNSN